MDMVHMNNRRDSRVTGLTSAMLTRLDAIHNPRFKAIMGELIRHLHAFLQPFYTAVFDFRLARRARFSRAGDLPAAFIASSGL